MSNVSKGTAFEKDVEQILRLKGYHVTRNNLINGTQIDLHASKNDPLDNISLVVECSNRNAVIGVDLVKEKSAVLLSLSGLKSLYRLMFVSKNGFSAEAKAFADSQPNIILLTINELENLLVDLTPYVQSYIYNYEKSLGIFKDANLFENYIDLSARDERKTIIPSLGRYVRDWLNHDENNLLFLLGDYGAGKTSFSRNLAYDLLRSKYVEAGGERFTPILVNLRDNRGKLDLKRVVIDALTVAYGVDLPSFAALERLCSTGNILLILDGFDEMSDRCDSITITDAFNQIYLFAALEAKVLLTCRSNFFRSHADIIELLRRFSIALPIEGEDKFLELPLKDQGKILYVEKLNTAQIREFVEKRFGSKTEAMLTTIKRIHDLSDLSTRPVLLDMIVSTLPELEKAKGKINSAALYSHYTDRWTTRDQWRVTIPLKVRQHFCELLAWAMHCADASGITHATLERIMANALRSMTENPEQLEKFKNDIQTCSFLVRFGDNDEFRFAHRSFREFFVGRKLIIDLCAGTKLEKSDITDLLPDAKNLDTYVSGPVLLSSSYGLGKSSTISYFQNVLNDRMRSSSVFLDMQEIEVGSLWGGITSDTLLRSHLETELRAVFSKQWMSSYSEEVRVSEEIATFAIEFASNNSLGFHELSAKASDSNAIEVLSNIIRLANAPDWIQSNSEALKIYSINGANQELKIATTAALINQPKLASIDFLREARGGLPSEGWSYILFELTCRIESYSTILSTLYQEDDLSAVDQIICIYGLGHANPSGWVSDEMLPLLTKLLRSENENEKLLAIKVCNSLPSSRRLAIASRAFVEAQNKEQKIETLSIFGELVDARNWRRVRQLALQESDPDVREAILQIERRLLDMHSRHQNKFVRNRKDSTRLMRESIWKWKR